MSDLLDISRAVMAAIVNEDDNPVVARLDPPGLEPDRSISGPPDSIPIAVEEKPNPHMTLTPEEHEWAMNVKEMVELEPGLEPLSDFWYAQLAICEQGNLERAVEKAHGLQEFFKEYDIVESANHGIKCMNDYFDARPGLCLDVTNDAGEGVSLAMDFSKAYDFASPLLLRGYYYSLLACSSDLAQIREGTLFLIEYEGFDWKKNFGWKDMKLWWDALGAHFPLNHRFVYFHTSAMANVLLTMINKLVPKEKRKHEFLPCNEVSRLDTIYLIPSAEAAMQKLKARAEDGLRRRYANEAAFTLC